MVDLEVVKVELVKMQDQDQAVQVEEQHNVMLEVQQEQALVQEMIRQ